VIDITTDESSNTLNVTLSGADAGKFTLSGGRSRGFKLTFEATDFEARIDAAYSVKVKAIIPDFFGNNTNIRIITLAVFSGVEKLAFVVIENANAWNDDNNSMLVINNFITFIENPK
jgi:hypothetical protein